MKKFFLTVASLALLGSEKASAISGGPFDNGDAGSILLERGSFYQCQFSFQNGNGYGVFTPDSQVSGNGGFVGGGAIGGGGAGGGGQGGLFTRGNLFSDNTSGGLQRNANRSVFYYKGVTYFGACFGMPDLEARKIVGSCNASSDVSGGNISNQATATGGAAGGSGVVNSSLNGNAAAIVSNNTGFVLNAGWEAKIFQTKPTLRFRGKGEIAVISPTGQSAITNLAYSGFSRLIDAIVQSVGNSGGQILFDASTYTEASAAIIDALGELRTQVQDGGGTDATYSDADVAPMRVSGVRRYF